MEEVVGGQVEWDMIPVVSISVFDFILRICRVLITFPGFALFRCNKSHDTTIQQIHSRNQIK